MAAQSDIRFVAEATTRDRLSPRSLIEPIAALGAGLFSKLSAQSRFVLNTAPGVAFSVDPWILYEQLGQFAIVGDGPTTDTFKIPDPADVLPQLELARRQWLNMLPVPVEQLRRIIVGSDQMQPEALVAAVRQNAYANLTMLNVLILYIRNRWNILPNPPLGVLVGLAQEIDLWSAHLPPAEDRHPDSQAVLERFAVVVEGLIGRRPVHMPMPAPAPAVPGSRVRDLQDIARLQRYFAHAAYLEIRGLAANRYHYLALLFTNGRIVVDTAQKENRFFLWQGPHADVLDAIATIFTGTAIKQAMEQHTLCVGAHEHDDDGRQALTRFLQ